MSDKKENIQLPINSIIAPKVTSSIIVLDVRFSSFKEVKTIKQIPSRLDAAFNICGDFSLFPFIVFRSNIMNVFLKNVIELLFVILVGACHSFLST